MSARKKFYHQGFPPQPMFATDTSRGCPRIDKIIQGASQIDDKVHCTRAVY